MQGTQNFLQQATPVTSSRSATPFKEKNPHLYRSPNGRQMQLTTQANPMQYSQLPTQIYPMNSTTTDVNNVAFAGFRRLLAELKAKKFDKIRFAAYRTASKLRYIQKRTLLSSIELGRLLETFQELGLHMTDPATSVNRQGTEHLLNRIYVTTVPLCMEKGKTSNDPNTQLVIAQASEILLGWLTYILDPTNCGRLTVSGLRVALSTLVTGKPVDKFNYHYSLLVNSGGAPQLDRLETYLQELLSLAVGVFEEPNFSYNAQTSKFLFTSKSKMFTQEEFLERMLAEPGPQSFSWLKVFHRLAIVENVQHSLRCEGCNRAPIVGLRYKCTRCPRYNLCQDCFWTGITTDSHTNSHDVKEYASATKTHSKQFGHSLRKSFQFGRQQSLPTGQTVPPLPHQPQLTYSVSAVRPSQPIASFQQCQFYRPGLPPSVLQSTSIPPGFFYSVPTPGPMTFACPPPTPVMQTRAFHRATSVPLQSLLPPQSQPPHHLQDAFGQTFIATTMQSLPPLGRESSLPAPVTLPRHQIPPLHRPAVIPDSHPKQHLTGAPSQRQSSSDGEIATSVVAAPTPVGSAPGHSDGSMEGPGSTLEGVQARKHIQQSIQEGPFRQISTQASVQHLDENNAIANYTTCPGASRIPSGQGSMQSQRDLVSQLEAKNREILLEIQRLKIEQMNQAAGISVAMRDSSMKLQSTQGVASPQPPSSDAEDPQLVAELNSLRQRKSELEARMGDLQGNRRDLTIQLETLMHLLKTSPNRNDDSIYSLPCHQRTYSRSRVSSAALPRRSCSLIRRTSGSRIPLEALDSDSSHQRSLDAESTLTVVGNTMSLQRRSNNRFLLPQHHVTDESHKSRSRNLPHSLGPASGAQLSGNPNHKAITPVMDRCQAYPAITKRGANCFDFPESARSCSPDPKEQISPNTPSHSSKVTLELSNGRRNSNSRQREALSISVRSQQCHTRQSGSYSAESDCGESSQSSRRRPFNCAAAFESSDSAINSSSQADVYQYSDPEMFSSGWQDGRSGRKHFRDVSSAVTTANTTDIDKTSSVAVINASTNRTRASGDEGHSGKNEETK